VTRDLSASAMEAQNDMNDIKNSFFGGLAALGAAASRKALGSQLMPLRRRKRGAPRGIRPSEEDKKAMAMIDIIRRENGLTRKVVQPVVIRWMVKMGKFKVQERSTHRKRLDRYYHERLVRALLGI
jgi:hypothetical protein